MFQAHVLIVRRAKLYYKITIKQVSGLKSLKLFQCDDTRDCIIQFCPPDDEHMCSKHVEA